MMYRFFLLMLFPLVTLASIEPRTQFVELTEFTQLNVAIVPDLGTRFVFPFVLDEEDENVPFTSKITNPVFVSTREKGRNFFVITLPPQESGGRMPSYLGNLFVNVAGYNISVVLKSTSNTKLHYTDIVFKLSSAARQKLIAKAVKEQVDAIKADYLEKERQLDKRAYSLSLKNIGALLVEGGDVKRISEEKEFVLNDESLAILDVEKRYKYGDFNIFTYEFLYDGTSDKKLRITHVQLFGKTDDGTEELIPSLFAMNSYVSSGDSVKGNLTTDQKNIDQYIGFQINVSTSLGNIKLDW